MKPAKRSQAKLAIAFREEIKPSVVGDTGTVDRLNEAPQNRCPSCGELYPYAGGRRKCRGYRFRDGQPG